MKKIYYLSSCDTDTCRRILKDLEPLDGFTLQDIKTDSITPDQLSKMHELTKSYEALFSKRARLYKEKGLAEKTLTETEYRSLILEHYTFLKRPVILFGDKIFVGNSKKVVEAAKETINS